MKASLANRIDRLERRLQPSSCRVIVIQGSRIENEQEASRLLQSGEARPTDLIVCIRNFTASELE